MSTFFEQEIDPLANPDRANDMVRQLTDTKSQPPPMMIPPPSDVTVLPGGYLDADGRIHKEVRIREINGSDEEALARETRNPNFTVARVVDLILRRTVLSIGGIDPVTPEVLGQLLTGDRAALLLAVRILTFGSDWEVPDFPCRLCGQTFGVTIELEKDIKVKTLENPADQEIDVPLRNGHSASVRLLTGVVQLEMVGDGTYTGPEEQTIAINRCLRKLDGQPVLPPVAQRMSMADRRTIIKAMDEAQPGPLMEEVSVRCERCGREANYVLSLVDLFR